MTRCRGVETLPGFFYSLRTKTKHRLNEAVDTGD